MRLFGAMVVVAFAGATGCATAMPNPSPRLVRIVSTTEVTTFIGDVAGVDYVYGLKPVDPPGKQIFAVVGPGCPDSQDPGQVYRVSFGRKHFVFGVNDQTDRRTVTELVVTACEAVGA